MPDLLIRNLEEKTLARLKARARVNGRSLQAELKAILEQAAARGAVLSGPPPGLLEFEEGAQEFRAQMEDRTFSDSARLIREDRDR